MSGDARGGSGFSITGLGGRSGLVNIGFCVGGGGSGLVYTGTAGGGSGFL